MSSYFPTVFAENLLDAFDDFDREFFRGFGRPEHVLYGKNAQRMMKTDVQETENGYEVDVDLPGFDKNEIGVTLENGYLTISARKGVEKDSKNEKGRMLRQERYAGSLQRSFYVGEEMTENDIRASYENGVLHLNLPRKDTRKVPEKKVIHIEG